MSKFTHRIRWQDNGPRRDALAPDGLNNWLEENGIQYTFSVLDGYLIGINLTTEDAAAYMLKFNNSNREPYMGSDLD